MDGLILASLGVMVAGSVMVAMMLTIGRNIGRSVERSDDLERTFGDEEYIHMVSDLGTWKGEQALTRWKAEAGALAHSDLSSADARRFREAWADARMHFADAPETALADLDRLVADIDRALGYPTDDFEHMAGLLCVDHPSAVHHIRQAHAVTERAAHHEASAEELQEAIADYEAALDELVLPVSA